MNNICPSKPFEKNVKKTKTVDFQFKFLLGFFLSIIVICMTFFFCLFLFSYEDKTQSEILGEEHYIIDESKYDNFLVESLLDDFVYKFLNSDYKVKDSGAFAYVYGNLQDGVISLGDEYTYFEKGRIVLFKPKDEMKIFWKDYNRKYILFDDTKEYFPVNNSSSFYFRNYLGQHILQDFIDDYLRNKDFIKPLDNNKWSWEWTFYTPISQSNKHTMAVEIIMNPKTGYLKEMVLLDNGNKLCTFKFNFEKIDSLPVDKIFEGYEEVQISEVNLED